MLLPCCHWAEADGVQWLPLPSCCAEVRKLCMPGFIGILFISENNVLGECHPWSYCAQEQ